MSQIARINRFTGSEERTEGAFTRVFDALWCASRASQEEAE